MKLHEMITHRMTELDTDTDAFVSELRLVNKSAIDKEELRSLNYGADVYRERAEHAGMATIYNAVYAEQRGLCRTARNMSMALDHSELVLMIEKILDSMECPDQEYIKQQ